MGNLLGNFSTCGLLPSEELQILCQGIGDRSGRQSEELQVFASHLVHQALLTMLQLGERGGSSSLVHSLAGRQQLTRALPAGLQPAVPGLGVRQLTPLLAVLDADRVWGNASRVYRGLNTVRLTTTPRWACIEAFVPQVGSCGCVNKASLACSDRTDSHLAQVGYHAAASVDSTDRLWRAYAQVLSQAIHESWAARD